MYYLHIGASVIFFIGFIISLVYQFSLSIKVSTNRLNTYTAMRRLFVVSFCTWMSMFILVLVWNKTTWSFEKVLMAFVLFSLISAILAGVSAFGLWRRKL